jgi:hypothetical protein
LTLVTSSPVSRIAVTESVIAVLRTTDLMPEFC